MEQTAPLCTKISFNISSKTCWTFNLTSTRLIHPITQISGRTLVKRVEVGLSVQQVEEETVEEIMVQGGAVSPIVTIEPRRRKFHKAITITMPLPERMSAQYLRRRQNESLKLSQKQQGKTPIGSFFWTPHMYLLHTLISCSSDLATNFAIPDLRVMIFHELSK